MFLGGLQEGQRSGSSAVRSTEIGGRMGAQSAHSDDRGLGWLAPVDPLQEYRDESVYAQGMMQRTSIIRDFFPRAIEMIEKFLSTGTLKTAESTEVTVGHRSILTIEGDSNFQSIYQMLYFAVGNRFNIVKSKQLSDYQDQFDRCGARVENIMHAVLAMRKNGYDLPPTDSRKVDVLFKLNETIEAMLTIEQKIKTGFSKQFRRKIAEKRQQVNAELLPSITQYTQQQEQYFTQAEQYRRDVERSRAEIAEIVRKGEHYSQLEQDFLATDMRQSLALIDEKFLQLKAFYENYQGNYQKVLSLEAENVKIERDIQAQCVAYQQNKALMVEISDNQEDREASFARVETAKEVLSRFSDQEQHKFFKSSAFKKAQVDYQSALKDFQSRTRDVYKHHEQLENFEQEFLRNDEALCLQKHRNLQEIVRLTASFPFDRATVKQLEDEVAELQRIYKERRDGWNEAAPTYNRQQLATALEQENARLTVAIQKEQRAYIHTDLFKGYKDKATQTMQERQYAVSFIPSSEMRHANAQRYLHEVIHVDARAIYAALKECYSVLGRAPGLEHMPFLLENSESFIV